MIANKDGPVRAIRSVVGANSGAVTQRDWILYEGRIDVVTHLRVHAIRATWHFYDHSPAATGMRYYDNLNKQGVVIDGKTDTMARGRMTWQLVTGAQGSVTRAWVVDTDIKTLKWSSFYDDDTTPSWSQCTGDPFAYAAAGPTTGGVPNTDPLRGPAMRFVSTDVNYIDAPGVTVAAAERRVRDARTPLTIRVIPEYRVFGAACRGSAGLPELSAAGVPEIGGSVTVRVAPLDAKTAGILWFGASDKTWGSSVLPFDLGLIGMRGCSQYVSTEVALVRTHGGGRAEVTTSVPKDRALVGVVAFNQYLAIDPPANAPGLITSNGGELRIGG